MGVGLYRVYTTHFFHFTYVFCRTIQLGGRPWAIHGLYHSTISTAVIISTATLRPGKLVTTFYIVSTIQWSPSHQGDKKIDVQFSYRYHWKGWDNFAQLFTIFPTIKDNAISYQQAHLSRHFIWSTRNAMITKCQNPRAMRMLFCSST